MKMFWEKLLPFEQQNKIWHSTYFYLNQTIGFKKEKKFYYLHKQKSGMDFNWGCFLIVIK